MRFMKRILIGFTLVLGSLSIKAQQDTLKYRICLKDKIATEYRLDRPEDYLSTKALERRQRQGLKIDSTDLPVCTQYVNTLYQMGVNIIVKGKWENFVTVSCNDSTIINRISSLPFVKSVERVWRRPPSKRQKNIQRDTLINQPQTYPGTYYGAGTAQIQISHGDKLHEAGYRGQGMKVAVIDAGYHNADRIKALANTHIEGTKSFVNTDEDIYAGHKHGMMVWSCMAMNCPNTMVGTAPEASYWLLCSEDDHSEHLVEQDYWSAAVEFADSVGVDVINTSLGYYTFDDSLKNYTYRQLDGHYSLMSRQASHIADKGMVLVCSAGNSGANSWKKITPPADAENVLTVGAIDKQGILANFSSVGNTADNRIKPDVVAVGYKADMMGTDGNLTTANGTSFASPILCGMVVCLWQACPTLTAKELIALVRRAGDRADWPDNIYGYGIPDMWKAYQMYLKEHR